ncbi:MAG: hypothetical protein RDV48_13160 [Candidatus Eremiobacteraeota bacterium]|nr:hypothetical protein [Candidatus Eremiobacteraeota bacterium]
MDNEDLKESLEYLEEVLFEYERLVMNIGKNGLSASLLMNYRDEVQELMTELSMQDIDLRDQWRKVVTLDNVLRKSAQQFVNEVGHQNFKQYQIINDPPREHWWWYLNRTTAAPVEKKDWKFWKK